MRRPVISGFAFAAVLTWLSCAPGPDSAISAEGARKGGPSLAWTSYRNRRFGVELYYPAEWFAPSKTLAEDAGQSFVSADGKAEIVVSGAHDPRRRGAEAFLEEQRASGGYEKVTDLDVAVMSYRVKGERGELAFFEKTVFSCRELIINRLVFTYPKSERARYEPIIRKLDRRFHAGQGYDTPRNCA